MKEKVTNFELSEKLSELGFESDSHTGYWFRAGIIFDKKEICGSANYKIWTDEHLSYPNQIKAYNCWDLLMWLQKEKTLRNYKLEIGHSDFCFEPYEAITEEIQPQNALARAIIKTLKEKKCKQQ
jgi:hypothetical protein